MKVPIPNDWDGSSWFCIQLQWPDSNEFLGLLNGILTLMTRGRFWDEKTGSITEMQLLAWEIFDRNWPFLSCDGGGIDTQPDSDIIHFFSGCEDESEDNCMAACGYNPKAFKIENGILYVRDFCGEWVAVGALASPNEEPPPDIWGDIDPEPDFFACGKVEYIIDQFILLSNAAWDNWTNPFGIEGAMRSAVTSSVNLERAHVYEWMALLLAVSQGASKSDFNDATAVQNAKCAALGSVAATGTGTDSEVDAIVAALASAFNAQIGEVSEIPWAAYWAFVRDTFGRKDCRLLLSMGATDDTAYCGCAGAEAGPTDPTAAGWYYGAEQVQRVTCPGGFNWGHATWMEPAPHDIYGVYFSYRFVSGDEKNQLKRSNTDRGEVGYDTYLFAVNSDNDLMEGEYQQCTLTVFGETEALFPGSIRKSNGTQGGVIATPPVDVDDIVLAILAGQANGDPASGTYDFVIRYLHNTGSPSHA